VKGAQQESRLLLYKHDELCWPSPQVSSRAPVTIPGPLPPPWPLLASQLGGTPPQAAPAGPRRAAVQARHQARPASVGPHGPARGCGRGHALRELGERGHRGAHWQRPTRRSCRRAGGARLVDTSYGLRPGERRVPLLLLMPPIPTSSAPACVLSVASHNKPLRTRGDI